MTSVCTDQIPAAAESAALSLGYSSLKPEQRDVSYSGIRFGEWCTRGTTPLQITYTLQLANHKSTKSRAVSPT